ncbi:MAG: carotenoid biosynthesis protein [Salinivirgaceae bacterium]|mgnify:CR=1 FL=1|nr:MAG: carotenoid biosynthesis protein [Salinivirgaceae bacterium]
MKKFFTIDFNNEMSLVRAVISVYIIGIIGFIVPYSHDLFLALTPLNLAFSLFVLLWAVRKELTIIHGLFFLIVYLLGYAIEVVGVNTGWPFGEYAYGDVLGIKLFDTPLFIGVNWLLLIISSLLIARHILSNKWLVAIAGATMMVIFDVALEPFAIATKMWTWESASVPFENYLSWWVIAFVMHLIVVNLKFPRVHKVAYAVFLAQIVFFLITNIRYYLIDY